MVIEVHLRLIMTNNHAVQHITKLEKENCVQWINKCMCMNGQWTGFGKRKQITKR